MPNNEFLKPPVPRTAPTPARRTRSGNTTPATTGSSSKRGSPRNPANTTVLRQPPPPAAISARPGAMAPSASGPSQRVQPPVKEKFNKLFFTSPLPRSISRIYNKLQTDIRTNQAAGPPKGSSNTPSSLSRSFEADSDPPAAITSPRSMRTAPQPSTVTNAQQAIKKNATDNSAANEAQTKHRLSPRRAQIQGANKKTAVNVTITTTSLEESSTRPDIPAEESILSAFGEDIYDIPRNEEEQPVTMGNKEREIIILKRRQIEKESKVTPQKRPPPKSPAQVSNKVAKISTSLEELNKDLPARATRSTTKQVSTPLTRKPKTLKNSEPKKSANKTPPGKSETKVRSILPLKNLGYTPPGILEATGTQWDPKQGRRVSRRVSSGVRDWWVSTAHSQPSFAGMEMEKAKAHKGKHNEQEFAPRSLARKSDAAKDNYVGKDVQAAKTQPSAKEKPDKKEAEREVSKTPAPRSTTTFAKAGPALNPGFEFSDEED
ncbi:hypothetical protein RUND412_011113 [Rhizina undulata]